MKRFLSNISTRAVVAMVIVAWVGIGHAASTQPTGGDRQMIKVLLTMDGKEIVSTFESNAAANDFLALLPLTLKLEDYNNTEKISDIPKRLSTDGVPEGIDPEVGDIAYYAPWGNLAIFYRDFGYSRGLVRLGKITSGIELLKQKGPISVTIKRAE